MTRQKMKGLQFRPPPANICAQYKEEIKKMKQSIALLTAALSGDEGRKDRVVQENVRRLIEQLQGIPEARANLDKILRQMGKANEELVRRKEEQKEDKNVIEKLLGQIQKTSEEQAQQEKDKEEVKNTIEQLVAAQTSCLEKLAEMRGQIKAVVDAYGAQPEKKAFLAQLLEELAKNADVAPERRESPNPRKRERPGPPAGDLARPKKRLSPALSVSSIHKLSRLKI